LNWKYEATDPTGEAGYGENFPLKIGTVADGKIYIVSSEHSPVNPLNRGALLRCIDAYNGNEVWTISHWSAVQHGTYVVISDGYLVDCDAYDMQIYTFGKGQTETTVQASPKSVASGQSIVIEGTVTDQSPGAKGTPAIADEYMSEWMEYLYKQYPKPSNAQGVTVHLTATDASGNVHEIGTATCDDMGNYATSWAAPSTGLYKVTATFEGSNSYFASEAGTAFVAGSAQAAVSPTPTSAVEPPTSGMPATTYIAILAAVIIIVVAAVALVLRRRK
jgi:hypothetical protein